MSTKLISLSFVTLFAIGCSSPKQTANGVSPSNGFAGRSLRVEISGDATTWTGSATVAMGSGVTVNSVSAASPTDLFADITIDPTATLGMRDVTVSDGHKTFTLSQAFEIDSPIELVVQGSIGQGGVPFFTLVNHDAENRFDSTTDANGNYVNLTVTGPTGTTFVVSLVTDLSASGRAFIDTTATAGDLLITQGQGSAALMSDAGSFAIAPRTATPLTNDTPVTAGIANIGDSQLFSLAAQGGSTIAHVSVTTTDKMAQLAGAMFPDGTWAHATGLRSVMNAEGNIDFVVNDFAQYAGYSFTVTGAAEPLTAADQGSGHTGNGNALHATAIPFEQTGGMVNAQNYMQVISFTVDAAHANRKLELTTDMGSDIMTATDVNIVDGDGKGYLSRYYQGGPSGPVDGTDCGLFSCTTLGEDVVSDPLPAGTYYIQITASVFSWTAADQSYLAIFWFT
jgi:hypothetical protein